MGFFRKTKDDLLKEQRRIEEKIKMQSAIAKSSADKRMIAKTIDKRRQTLKQLKKISSSPSRVNKDKIKKGAKAFAKVLGDASKNYDTNNNKSRKKKSNNDLFSDSFF